MPDSPSYPGSRRKLYTEDYVNQVVGFAVVMGSIVGTLFGLSIAIVIAALT
jgi:hypothetical protein